MFVYGSSSYCVLQAVNNLGCSVWFSPEECLKVTVKDKRFIYVFDEFTGDAFHHLFSIGCRYENALAFTTDYSLDIFPRTVKSNVKLMGSENSFGFNIAVT